MCEMCLKCIFSLQLSKHPLTLKQNHSQPPPPRKNVKGRWGGLGQEQGRKRFSYTNYSTVINNGSRQNQQELVKKMPSIHGYN